MGSDTVFLMYHRIGAPQSSTDRYTVSEAAFEAQVDHLRASGYEVTNVTSALAAPPSARPRVALTFDDGSDTDLLVAAPRLAAHGFGATFYAVPGLLGRPGFMTEAQLVELSRMGFEIGSHSMTHPYLNDVEGAALRNEVLGSKRVLEEIVGRRVAHFCCPGGRCNRRVRAAVQEAGYDSLATSQVGVYRFGDDPFSLRRVDIQQGTTLGEFRRVCRGESLARRQMRTVVLGAAKTLLGNGSYDRVRRVLLS